MKSMLIPYISEYEIIEIIKSLKNSSASYDNIPASFPSSKMGINKIYQIIGRYQYYFSFLKYLRKLCITI